MIVGEREGGRGEDKGEGEEGRHTEKERYRERERKKASLDRKERFNDYSDNKSGK